MNRNDFIRILQLVQSLVEYELIDENGFEQYISELSDRELQEHTFKACQALTNEVKYYWQMNSVKRIAATRSNG